MEELRLAWQTADEEHRFFAAGTLRRRPWSGNVERCLTVVEQSEGGDRVIRLLTILRDPATLKAMKRVGFTYWQDGEFWLGYLDEYPDYQTQGKTLDELKEHLLDIHNDLSNGLIPCARRHSELEIA